MIAQGVFLQKEWDLPKNVDEISSEWLKVEPEDDREKSRLVGKKVPDCVGNGVPGDRAEV